VGDVSEHFQKARRSPPATAANTGLSTQGCIVSHERAKRVGMQLCERNQDYETNAATFSRKRFKLNNNRFQ